MKKPIESVHIFRNQLTDLRSTLKWNVVLRIAQIVATVGLTALLVRSIDWASLGPLLAQLVWPYVLASTLLLLGAHIINVMRWRFLVQQRLMTYHRLLIYYGAGLFSNNFLPTGIGGDGVRAALLSRDISLPRAIFSVALDRILGLFGLSAFVIVGIVLGIPPGIGLSRLSSWNNAASVLSLLAGTSIVVAGLLACLPSWRRWLWSALIRRIDIHAAPHWTPWRWLRLLAGGYGFSVVSNMGTIGAHWAIFQALGLGISLDAAIWVVLAVSASMLLPLAVNGLGLQESVYVLVLAHYGISTTSALAVALIMRALLLGFSLLGGLLSLSWSNQLGEKHSWLHSSRNSME